MLFPCPLGLGATTWVEGSGTGTRQEPLREGEKRVGLCQGAGLAGEGGASVEGWGQGPGLHRGSRVGEKRRGGARGGGGWREGQSRAAILQRVRVGEGVFLFLIEKLKN